MSIGGQMLHATHFPRNVGEEQYRKLLHARKPIITPTEWPTVEDENNKLFTAMRNAEDACLSSKVPVKGTRWSPLMALVNCKVSPVMYLMLISEGLTCRDCKLK